MTWTKAGGKLSLNNSQQPPVPWYLRINCRQRSLYPWKHHIFQRCRRNFNENVEFVWTWVRINVEHYSCVAFAKISQSFLFTVCSDISMVVCSASFCASGLTVFISIEHYNLKVRMVDTKGWKGHLWPLHQSRTH